MTRPIPIFDVLSRLENESSGRSECMMPLDDDWKERLRALNQNAEAECKEQPSQNEE